ncbi:3'-5' exoribonuclease HELZ2-like [Saccoglossus kowalevskii]
MANRFTHVFIDEADQIDYQSIIPCQALASSIGKTIIVGDLAQKIETVLPCNFGGKSAIVSFLYHYSITPLCLKRVYRYTESIRRFLNTHMYPNIKIVGNAESSIDDVTEPIHAIIPQIQGNEPRNWISDITGRVSQLYHDWPEEWGQFKEKSIGIIVECHDQIYSLHMEFTSKGMPIVVNTLKEFQGKEFVVIILSLSAQPIIGTHNMDLLVYSMSRAQKKFYVAYPDPIDSDNILKHCNDTHSLQHLASVDNCKSVTPILGPLDAKITSIYNAQDNSFTCNEDGNTNSEVFILETYFFQGESRLNERLSDDDDDDDYNYLSEEGSNDYSDYNSEEDESLFNPYLGDEHLHSYEDVLFKELPKYDLEKMLASQSDKYKRCRLETWLQEQDRVTLLDEEPDFEIRIPNKLKRGRALNQDTVVIELMDENRKELHEMGDDKDDTKIKYGKVVGILERHEEPRMKKIACMLDEHSDNLLVPINGNFPKMSWHKGQQWKETNKHAVCLPIYRITRFQNFELDHIEEVTTSERSQKIFIARFLNWNVNKRYPLCVAVDVLPMGNTLENGLNILKAKYDVKDNKTTLEPNAESHSVRRDLCAIPTFTIDPSDARDLDDALSLEKLENGNFRIGVHIADVASHVPVDSSADMAARKRGTSYYPPEERPIHMLPRSLSEITCSLQPNTEKNALSHLFEVNTAGHVLSQDIIQTKIKPVHQLSYEEAERIITSGNIQDEFHEISSQLVSLNELAQKMRRQRLGMAYLLTESGSYGEEPHTTPFAQQLVEEMMIMTNKEVAKMLVAKYPSCTPLRRQLKPQNKHFEQWLDSFDNVLECSINISSKPSISANMVNGEFVIMDKVWEAIKDAHSDGSIKALKQIAFEDQNFPQLFLMAVHFYGIQEKAEYVCSDPDKTKLHFTLNCPVYVRCTSPIRRYMDLVIQRMVIAAIHGDESPYNKEEIVKMCTMCNQTEDKQKCFESDCRALKFALKVHNTPLKAMAVVETANDSSIDLQIPRVRSIPSSERKIPLSLMNVSTHPKYDEAAELLSLSWSEHIYDSKLSENNVAEPTTRNNTTIQLQRMRHTFATSTETWYNFIMSVLHGNQHNSRRLITQLEQERRKCNRENAVTHDISSERIDKKGNRIDPCCFTGNFRMSDVLELQIGGHYSRGILSPSIESVKLSVDFDICIEHRKDAVGCFSVNAEKKMPPLRNRHGWKINNYQNRWFPILSMSAAESAVRHNENIFIKSLLVTWSVSSQGEYIGTFFLPSNFCESRHITTFRESYGDQGHDYICVKCQQSSVNKEDTKFTNGDTLFFDKNFCWIAHCVVSGVQVKKKDDSNDEIIIVDMKLKSTSVNILEQRLTSEQSSVELICTVEIIKKSIPDRRVQDTVRMLGDSTDFVQQIALGHPPKSPIPRQQSLRRLVMKVSTNRREGLPSLNQDQIHAIKMSLENKFTIVQGPPGTGKSYTAANLANAFVLSNRDEPSMKGGRILYCAPSNKAVDVAADYLKRFDMNTIRMYSKSMEGKDYPVPGLTDITRYKRGNNAESNPALDDIALHRVIRKASSKCGKEIREFDSRFRNAIPQSKQDIENYKALIKKAEKDALIGCDVILCTCSEAASKRLDKLGILQCIIDEAGMCTEPETLVPLVRAKPEQVVLIGDHRQLQPIVPHNLSSQMGLGVSLLERYCDENHFIRLKMQYRMHDAICEFPNSQFYDGELETAETVLKRSQFKTTMDGVWPGGKHVPTVFCHCVGREESLKVTTDEGSEQSKKNLQEVKDVVRIAKIMSKRYSLRTSRIQILSQYRAQCHEIKGELKRANCQSIGVNSVIGFQGSEQDYIILSTVRSLPQREIEERPTKGWLKKNLGFVTDEHQINVALTRARKGLIIIGNANLLRTDHNWRKLLEEYRRKNCCVDARNFPSPET